MNSRSSSFQSSEGDWADGEIPGERVFVRRCHARPAAWDEFAQRCGASFRCAYWAGPAWQFEHHWAYRLRRWEILLASQAGEVKIGQCAVGVGRRVAVFADGIALLPEFAAEWPAAITAVLRATGSASYVYGSDWSTEPPRESALKTLAGVRVQAVAPTNVQVVDFRRWADYPAYERAVSTNVRRNVKKAEKTHPSLTILVETGFGQNRYAIQSVTLRRRLFQRKGVVRSTLGMVARSAARLLSLRRHSRTAYLVADGRLLATYSGINFGAQTYYLEGASDPDAKGVHWYLLMAMIEEAYARCGGQGQFVLGSDDGTQAGVEAWEGLRRSRAQSCATPVPTSVVRFAYAREADADAASGAVRPAPDSTPHPNPATPG